jgi:hypothetical protein
MMDIFQVVQRLVTRSKLSKVSQKKRQKLNEAQECESKLPR